jgi:hypothetical protein
VPEIASYNRKDQAEMDERRSMRIPAGEPDEMDLGEAWNVLAERGRDAVVQPPKATHPRRGRRTRTRNRTRLR